MVWPRDDDEREKERTITELFNIDWRETSFVPAGDNPPAKIVLWKAEPDLTDEEISEIIDEVERRPEVAEVDTLAQRKIESDPEGKFSKIADPHARLAAARAEVRSEEPRLQDQESALAAQKPAAVHEPVKKRDTEFAKIDRAARERYPDLYDESPSLARRKYANRHGADDYNREFWAS